MRAAIPTLLACLATLLVTSVAGCGDEAAPGGAAPAAPGKLTVGTEPAYPPFESVRPDGELEGLDIDLARALARHLGREIQFRPMQFKAIIPDLDAGRLDLAISGISYTDERAKKIDFSAPYLAVPMGVLLSTEKAAHIQTSADLDSEDVLIVVQEGTSGMTKAQAAFSEATINAFAREVDAANEVAAGGAHAMVYDRASVQKHHAKHPDATRILDVDLGVEHYCIAFPKGSKLRAQVDAFLAQASTPGGTLDAILGKWLPRPELFRVKKD